VSAVSKIAVAADCSETASVFAEHDRDAGGWYRHIPLHHQPRVLW
jgi:hypothetical protein